MYVKNYMCKEMVIIIPPPKLVAINCNTKDNRQKIHTIHVNKANLTIYMNKFQHREHSVLLVTKVIEGIGHSKGD